MDDLDFACGVGVSALERPVLSVVAEAASDESLSVEQLGSRIVGLAGRLAAATGRWLLLVADFDARDGAHRFGLPSTAWWLAHYCGLSRRTARDHVRVARTLAAHPRLAEGMQAGRLSYSHVRAISRVAELGDQSLISSLIMIAEHGTVGQLEDTVRGLRSVDDNQQPSAPPVEALSHRWRPDSRWGLSAALDPEHGALVESALDTLARREHITRAEALTRMAEITLATLAADGPAPVLRGDERAAIIVHNEAAAVPTEPEPAEPAESTAQRGSAEPSDRDSSAEPRPYARLAAGPGLSREVVERLACAGRIRTVVYNPRATPDQPRQPLDIGANRRLVSDKQYRALLLRDHGCRHPGCGSSLGLEAHHVRHWLWGGKTVMANLVLLCSRHHHAHHHGEFSIAAVRGGQFQFQRADGTTIPAHIDPSSLTADPRHLEDEHADIPTGAATTRWDGTHLDRHYTVATLAQNLNSTRRTA